MSDLLKTIPQYLIPKRLITVLAGCLAGVKNSSFKNYIIRLFINAYQVNMSEALIEDPSAYASFNDFFIRHLKPECRPLAQADIVSPVDGCVSELGRIKDGQLIQAKGRTYSVHELLACDKDQALDFVHGQFATLYLSPKDYHRVHMPIEAQLTAMTYIPGSLFSVQPATARVIPRLFARNERIVLFFNTKIGPMAMVMVGATIVGAIGTRWHGELRRRNKRQHVAYPTNSFKYLVSQGDEIGFFKLGSTVILLFADKERMEWDKTLKAGSLIRFGQPLGEIN